MTKKMIKIKFVKSVITEKPKARRTVKALGLKRLNQVVERPDNPQIRGMINRVSHLVKII